jgi:hypothetical protein
MEELTGLKNENDEAPAYVSKSSFLFVSQIRFCFLIFPCKKDKPFLLAPRRGGVIIFGPGYT